MVSRWEFTAGSSYKDQFNEKLAGVDEEWISACALNSVILLLVNSRNRAHLSGTVTDMHNNLSRSFGSNSALVDISELFQNTLGNSRKCIFWLQVIWATIFRNKVFTWTTKENFEKRPSQCSSHRKHSGTWNVSFTRRLAFFKVFRKELSQTLAEWQTQKLVSARAGDFLGAKLTIWAWYLTRRFSFSLVPLETTFSWQIHTWPFKIHLGGNENSWFLGLKSGSWVYFYHRPPFLCRLQPNCRKLEIWGHLLHSKTFFEKVKTEFWSLRCCRIRTLGGERRGNKSEGKG